MIKIRKSETRGHADNGWLNTYHTFSFASYFNRNYMSYRDLRVINEDRISESSGFGSHPHKNMEIISYVISGKLKHKDDLGNGSIINEGEFQLISAGNGITHSEFNPQEDKETHFYQIWITPKSEDTKPKYYQKNFNDIQNDKPLKLIASSDGRDDSFTINQDVNLYHAKITKNSGLDLDLSPNRYAYIQVISGNLKINTQQIKNGDGVIIDNEERIEIEATSDSEILFFDLN